MATLAKRIEKLERTKPPPLPMRIHNIIVQPCDDGPSPIAVICARTFQRIDRADDEGEAEFLKRADEALP